MGDGTPSKAQQAPSVRQRKEPQMKAPLSKNCRSSQGCLHAPGALTVQQGQQHILQLSCSASTRERGGSRKSKGVDPSARCLPLPAIVKRVQTGATTHSVLPFYKTGTCRDTCVSTGASLERTFPGRLVQGTQHSQEAHWEL